MNIREDVIYASKEAAQSELIVKYLEEKIPLYQFLCWCRGIAYLTR